MSKNGIRVIEAVRELASAQPDYVYGQRICVYVERDSVGEWRPSCLIGQALWSVGLIDEGWIDANNKLHNTQEIRVINRPCGFGFDDNEVNWLGRVQPTTGLRYHMGRSRQNR